MFFTENLFRAAWPELQRGSDLFGQLTEMWYLLEQESTSLRHLTVDNITVVSHLGREMPVPLAFCDAWEASVVLCFLHLLILKYSLRPSIQ